MPSARRFGRLPDSPRAPARRCSWALACGRVPRRAFPAAPLEQPMLKRGKWGIQPQHEIKSEEAGLFVGCLLLQTREHKRNLLECL